jgi:hypothetical protein
MAVSCSVCIGILAVLSGLGFFVLEHRATVAWPPGGSFAQTDSFQTTEGQGKLPIIYFDGSLVGVFYLVDPAAAQEMLPNDLEPMVLPFVNKAISGIFMFSYRNTTIGPYGEMGLTIQTRRKGSGATLIGYLCDMVAHIYKLTGMLRFYSSSDTGLYVVTLPVEVEGAKAAGRQIWGYNKYISEFSSDFTKPESMSFTLGKEFSFEMGRPSYGLTMAGLPFLTYTHLNGNLIRTVVEVGHKAHYGFKDLQLNIFGTGETADRMKRLGLDRTSPLAAFRTDALHAHLPRGMPVH